MQLLHGDRDALAARLQGRRWLSVGLGLVAAAVVASPVLPEGPMRTSLLVAAMVAGVALPSRYHQVTGVQLSRVGARAALVYAAGLAVSMVLLSVSYGLASFGLVWWVAATAVLAFVLVTLLVDQFVSAAADHLRHGL